MDEKEPEADPQGSLIDLVNNTTAMKDDVAAIKAQTDEKEPEDAPQDPLTDLVMEVNNGEIQTNKAKQVLMNCCPENSLEAFANSSDTSQLSSLPEVTEASSTKSKVQILIPGCGHSLLYEQLYNETKLDFVVFLKLIS
ncbi:hypothetical protein E3N88_37118 [Mikania micrantha]|uniref:Uncharacterized protein n=1 Tax=Mikania micrantha TaxID=192012 RepID=A0A5N6M683_9ASTR|nr:hypothetical protein E3N88_37118 [Mikania micrantha]